MVASLSIAHAGVAVELPRQLGAALNRTAQVASEHRGRGITEQDTRNALIEPVLAALGWAKEDLGRVRAEYRHTSRDNPVDYALFAGAKPVMFVEAKALDVPIDDRKAVNQVLSYAVAVNVKWALISNGWQWHLYSTFTEAELGGKRLFAITAADPEAAEWLAWTAPDRLQGEQLERLRDLLLAERKVLDAVNRMFAERNDALVGLIAREVGLGTADVALALQVLQPSLGAATVAGRSRLVALPGAAPPISVPPVPASLAHTGGGLVHSPPMSPSAPPGPDSGTSVPRAAVPPAGTDVGDAAMSIRRAPDRGRKPASLRIGEETYRVHSWSEVLVCAMRHAHQARPVRYEGIFTAAEFGGRKRRRFQRERDGMTAPREVPGGFAETNLSSADIADGVAALLAFVGISADSASYTYRSE